MTDKEFNSHSDGKDGHSLNKPSDFNLSEKINQRRTYSDFIWISDVKEFIRLLKEEFEHDGSFSGLFIHQRLNHLAGEKLI